MKFKKTTLKNGLRVITIPMKDNPSTTVMVVAETGSNYETKEENGLSHFLEHMLFKGTPTRPSALTVSTELDSIGAESNAFTTNEMTAYYAKGERRHTSKLLDVVADIYLNASLPAAELEKERGVILQEIAMYEDLPQQHVWDVFGQLLYGDTPAGRSIAGSKENVKRFSQNDFHAYKARHYIAEKTLVVIAGDIDAKTVVKEVTRAFKDMPKGKKVRHDKVVEKQTVPMLKIEKKPSDQTHMVMGFRAYGARDKRSVKVSMLMSVLGAGMSSRLFQKLREEMGACYYVRTANGAYADHGFAAISTGVDRNRVSEVVAALLAECKRLTSELVADAELQKTKDYIVSHAYMNLETSDNVAGFFADEEIVRGELKPIRDLEKEIRAVTAKDIQKAAKDIFKNEKLNLAIVGNIEDEEGIKRVLSF